MSKPKIIYYGFKESMESTIVRLCLEELDLSYKTKEIDYWDKNEHLEPWYARINPSLLVPAINYKGEIITDSMNIIKILSELHPEKDLYPKDEDMKKNIDVILYIIYNI